MESGAHILGLQRWDWIAVFLYLAGITLIGFTTKTAIKSREDFFMAGRRFGKVLMIFHSFGAGTHTDHAVAVAGACYRNGVSGIWVQWQWMFTTPFYWLLAPVCRRCRCLTTADVFRDRFGESAAILFVVVSVLSTIVNIGVMLKGTGVVISSMTGGELSETMAILLITVSFIIYGIAGGLVAAVVTDLIQGIFILFLSFLMVPFALWSVGGLEGIRTNASSEVLTLFTAGAISIPVVLLLSLNAMVGVVAQSHFMAVTSAGKTEWEGRVGMTYGNFLKRICTLGWAMIGVCGIIIYPDLVATGQSESVFGYAVADLLPVGLSGIMLASIMAAAMSTCDALMVSSSALLTENIYKNLVCPDRTESHYVKIGRVLSFVVVFIAVGASFLFPTVLEGIFIFLQMTASIGISFWLGILWKRMNTTGVFASFVVSTVVLYIAKFYLFTSAEYGTTPAIAYQTACFIPAGMLAGIVASLLTPALASEKVERFFVKIHTPIGLEHKLNLPIDQAIPSSERLIDCCGIFIVTPSAVSWIGFLAASLIVFILIFGTYLLLQL